MTFMYVFNIHEYNGRHKLALSVGIGTKKNGRRHIRSPQQNCGWRRPSAVCDKFRSLFRFNGLRRRWRRTASAAWRQRTASPPLELGAFRRWGLAVGDLWLPLALALAWQLALALAAAAVVCQQQRTLKAAALARNPQTVAFVSQSQPAAAVDNE
jgi:hypothetical protein